jgi:hypothetical protein
MSASQLAALGPRKRISVAVALAVAACLDQPPSLRRALRLTLGNIQCRSFCRHLWSSTGKTFSSSKGIFCLRRCFPSLSDELIFIKV